ncbi:hypothetical protein RIF29_07379 [Crotalaria pallida]|uniref:Uncharacterized protein n=1 Tax=Crotalaria pallida TaxID=3830 RepID=A0AAN9J4E6_CROPI
MVLTSNLPVPRDLMLSMSFLWICQKAAILVLLITGMGTKVEYSINLLATSVDSNNLTVGGGVDVWDHNQNKESKDNRQKRMIDRNNLELIKKTMQMHEDIFKHQVRELHRVYSVQRMLMDELKKKNSEQKFQTLMNGIEVSHPYFIEQQHQTAQISHWPNIHVQSMNMERGFDLERPAEEEIFTGPRGIDEGEAGPSSYIAFQSCKTSTSGYEYDEEEMEVDLTLSIGTSNFKKSRMSQLACLDSSPKGKTREGECSDPTTPMSSSSVTFTQERKGPCWLSQGLKLK